MSGVLRLNVCEGWLRKLHLNVTTYWREVVAGSYMAALTLEQKSETHPHKNTLKVLR